MREGRGESGRRGVGPGPSARLRGRARLAAVLAACVGAAAGCRSEMYDQPRYEALEASAFFADGQAARPVVAGTVPRGQLNADVAYATGLTADGTHVTDEDFPLEVDRELLRRGQQRYTIYCSPCHGRLGDGDGMIVRRGFSAPPSFHETRLRAEPAGHFFRVITHGHGAMYSYASRVPIRDRWAITAYIRALQLSQHAEPADVPESERAELEKARRKGAQQ